MDVAWIGLFAASNWLAPLENVDRSAFFGDILQRVDVHHGQLLALPTYQDAGLLYYRQDLLERFAIPQPPETWQELLEQAQIVQSAMRQETPQFYGFVWQGKQYEGLITNFQEFAGDHGGFVVDTAGSTRIILDLPQNRAALQFMHDLIWTYQVSPPSTYTEMQEEETRLMFQKGHALFERNWPYAWALHQQPDSPCAAKSV
jgi:multiple sugar transport system substrate-binding protein